MVKSLSLPAPQLPNGPVPTFRRETCLVVQGHRQSLFPKWFVHLFLSLSLFKSIKDKMSMKGNAI